MIYLAIFIFTLPLLIRLTWCNTTIYKFLKPTIYTYGLWYLFSFFLILLSVSLKTYLYLFMVFPFGLIVYECYRLWKQWTNIQLKPIFYLFISLIVVFFIFNLFTFKWFSDPYAYIQYGLSALKTNSLSITNNLYKFNSFYYLATIFGPYNVQFFYSIFLPFFTNVFLFFLIWELVRCMFPKIDKWYYSLVLIILIAFSNNNLISLQANWQIGTISFLFIMPYMFQKLQQEDNWENDTLALVSMTFFLNFSLTAIVVLLPLLTLVFIMFLFLGKKINYTVLLFILMSLCWGIIQFTSFLPFLFYSIAIAPIVLLNIIDQIWDINHFNIKKSSWLSSVGNSSQTLSKLRINKKIFLIVINVVFVLLVAGSVLTLYILKVLPIRNLTVDSAKVLITIIENYTLAVVVILLFNLMFFFKKKLLLIPFLFLMIMFLILHFAQISNIVPIPDYLSDRIQWTAMFFTAMLFLLFFLLVIETNKNKIIKISSWILIAPSFILVTSLITNNVTPIFSGRVADNNRLVNRKNFDFIFKNVPTGENNIFSEVGTTFNSHRYGPYENRIVFDQYIVNYLSIYNFILRDQIQKELNRLENKVIQDLETTQTYKVVILLNGSFIAKNQQIQTNLKTNYNDIGSNGDITLWIAK